MLAGLVVHHFPLPACGGAACIHPIKITLLEEISRRVLWIFFHADVSIGHAACAS